VILAYFLFAYTIADIRVESQWTDKSLILQTIGCKTGDEFRDAMIPQIIYSLNKLRLFNGIAVDTTIVADGIFIVIRIDEAPFLAGDPLFYGNKKIKSKDLLKRCELKSGQILTDRVGFNAKRRIIDLYEEKTYYNTVVRDSVVADTSNRVSLVFVIEEGTTLRIGKITIDGNEAFSDSKLKRKMSTKEKGFLRSGKLNKEKLKEDIDKISNYYKENGYLDVQIEEPQITADNNRLVIAITLTENRKYYVGDITFSGNELFTTPQLMKVLQFTTNDVYDMAMAQKTLQDMGSLYADEGYIYCSIGPVETVRDSIVDIVYVIQEGSPASINRVIITGNLRTREKVIRREIVTIPGERVRQSQVLRSMREVFNLGYFEDIKPATGSPDDSGNVDVIYSVKEKEGVGSVGAGMAYSAQDKITGYIELSHPNIFGRGQRIYTKLEVGGRLTNVQLGFTEPWLFDTRTSVGAELYYTNRLWDYYTKRDIGMAANFSFPFYLDYTRLGYTFRIERTQIFDIAGSYSPPSSGYSLYDDTIPKWTVGNSFGLTRDTRDYIFNPSSGSLLLLQSEFAKKFLFANIDYNRVTFEARTYFPLFWKFILVNRLRTGVVTSVDEVPYYKRFYAGGVGEDGVRGYPDRSLSPTDDGRTVGGDAIFVNNLEVKLKLSQGLAFLLFYDMGNAFPSYRDINLYNLSRGAGAGVRIEIPMMGVIGFDLGYGFDRDHPGFEPHFQINPFGIF